MLNNCSLDVDYKVEATGTVLIGGFEDGVIRIVSASLQEYMKKVPSPSEEYINLIQVAKPHTKAVTVITINPKGTIVVTGSEDSTIFVFKVGHGIQFVELLPIGYAPVSGPVSSCAWKPDESATLLVISITIYGKISIKPVWWQRSRKEKISQFTEEFFIGSMY